MNENERIPALLIISGPTASGKSALAEEIALEYHLPIISADSRQIYRGMDIGTAKPSTDIRSRICYEMIDFLNPDQNFSAGKFARKAAYYINEKYREEKIIIIAGGTGFYIKALIEGLADIPDISDEIDKKWDRLFHKNGIDYLQDQIKKLDTNYYTDGDLHNPHRLLRAIKIADQTKRSIYDYEPEPLLLRDHTIGYFALQHERKNLYDRINQRVDKMVEQGLVEEVRQLLPYKDTQAMKSVGYRELLPYLSNEISLEEATSKIKQHSRNYAKRQMTWMRKHGGWRWISQEETDVVREWVDDIISDK